MLVQHGANVNARSLQSPREEDHSFNNTPLHYVAIQPNYRETISLLNYLIDAGADVNVKNSLGETPLMWTANLQLLEDKPGITKEFIADLADVNLQNNIGDTYLHILIKNKDYMWIQKFLDMFGSMIDTSIKNVEGWTVLDTAKKTLQPESTRALERLKVIGLKDDVKTTDILGRTGLVLAIIRNDLAVARRQIEKGSDVNAKDKTRFANTPLHFAVTRHAHMEPFVELLVANRADVNFKNSYGDMPLHYLVKFNLSSPERDKVARMLINAGADPLIKNNRGKTPIDLAKMKNPSFSNDLAKWHKEYLASKEKPSEVK
jgi:ankyrin repeat protein